MDAGPKETLILDLHRCERAQAALLWLGKDRGGGADPRSRRSWATWGGHMDGGDSRAHDGRGSAIQGAVA